MDIALLLARLVLTAVFIVSGVGKLADLPGSRKATAGFGVPERLVPTAAVLLPIAELIVAAALLFTASARWGGLGGLALLILFIGVIGFNLARGRTPDCHCFGQLHSEPIGWSTIIRNVALSAVAAFIVVGGWNDPGTSAFAWLTSLSGSDVALLLGGSIFAVVLAVSGWVVVNLMEQNGRLLSRVEAIEQSLVNGSPLPVSPPAAPTPAARLGLEVGTVAPAFELPDLTGATQSLNSVQVSATPTLLLFTDPGCGPCNRMIPEVARWQRELASQLHVVVVSRGSREVNLGKSSEHGIAQILLQKDREVAQAYGAHGTPAAVIVRPDGKIGTPVAGGVESIRALVATVTAHGNAPAGTPPAPIVPSIQAQPAPAFSLPDLDGKTTSLSDLRSAGLPVVLFFTDARCDPCDLLLPEIGEWQTGHRDSITTVLISNGDVDVNREKTEAHGIKNVLLQKELELVNAYGIEQAPAAIVIQANGQWDGQAAYGDVQIRRLVERAIGRLASQAGSIQASSNPSHALVGPLGPLQVGDALPSMSMPTLDGEGFDTGELGGKASVLLFWNPTCGYCQRMVGDLKLWEANQTAESPRLIVISAGTEESTRAHGFSSTVVLDQGTEVGRMVGAHGTPAAVRIDDTGHIATPIAPGMSAVLALLNSVAPAPASANGLSAGSIDHAISNSRSQR